MNMFFGLFNETETETLKIMHFFIKIVLYL